MPVKDHVNAQRRVIGKIITVDPIEGVVEAAIKDGSAIAVRVQRIPPAFRWPEVSEYWSFVYEQEWVLEERQELDSESFTTADLESGQMKVDADEILTRQGDKVVLLNDFEGYLEGYGFVDTTNLATIDDSIVNALVFG